MESQGKDFLPPNEYQHDVDVGSISFFPFQVFKSLSLLREMHQIHSFSLTHTQIGFSSLRVCSLDVKVARVAGGKDLRSFK